MARACAPRVLSVHSTPPAPRRSVAPAPGDGAARGRAAGAGVLAGETPARHTAAPRAAVLFVTQRAHAHALAGVLLLTSPMNAPPARAVDFVMASPAAVDGLRRRDEAMQFKCKGGMMDCDGDRREFARKQTENFIAKASGSPAADSSCKASVATRPALCPHALTLSPPGGGGVHEGRAGRCHRGSQRLHDG